MIRSATWLAVLLCASVGVAQVKIGNTAPSFAIKTTDGKRIALSEYQGKVILLNFWATWCGPCQTEMPRFVRFQREYSARGFQVIGISMDDSDAPVRTFISKLKLNYPISMGDAKLAESYGGILGLPITLLIDRTGRIAKRYEGAVDLDAMQHDIERLLTASAEIPKHD